MFGYKVKYSIDIIAELIDNGHLKRDKFDSQGAINDLNVLFKYGNVSLQRYKYLMNKLNSIDN